MEKRHWHQRIILTGIMVLLISVASFKGVRADHRIFGRWTTTKVEDISRELDRKYAELKSEIDTLKAVDQRVQKLQDLLNNLEDSNLNLSQEDIEKLRFLINDVVSY